MALNESKGNMYDFVTHTWNAIKGKCFHDCSYCYMKKWGNLKPARLDEKELKTDLGSGNFIFVGSSCDMFAWDLPDEWIQKTIDHCSKYDNHYLFQTKSPARMACFKLPKNSVICTTIETNRFDWNIMRESPPPHHRAIVMSNMVNYQKYLTIEPIMNFDLLEFVALIKLVNPVQVNIGADSGGNKLPEPTANQIHELIAELSKFTIVHQKSNLKRLIS